jgi:Trk-type K+ transport system membrane component
MLSDLLKTKILSLLRTEVVGMDQIKEIDEHYSKAVEHQIEETPKIEHRYYYWIHLIYMLLFGIFSALAIFISENVFHKNRVFLVDALFMTFSGLCSTGLSTNDLSKYNLFSQLTILACIGSLYLFNNSRRCFYLYPVSFTAL